MSSQPYKELDAAVMTTPSTVWSPVLTVFLSLIIFFCFALAQLVGAIIALVQKIPVDELTSIVQENQSNMEQMLSSYDLVWPSTLASALVGSLLIWVFIRIKKVGFAEYLHLHNVEWPAWLTWAGIYVAILTVIQLLIADMEAFQTSFMEDVVKGTDNIFMLVLSVGVLAPIFEELLFRGFLYKGLERTVLGPHGTIWITAFVFAVIHMQYTIEIQLLVGILGAIFGYARYYSGSLAVPVVLHVLNNSASIIFTYLSLSDAVGF